jgi:hypothetical protein
MDGAGRHPTNDHRRQGTVQRAPVYVECDRWQREDHPPEQAAQLRRRKPLLDALSRELLTGCCRRRPRPPLLRPPPCKRRYSRTTPSSSVCRSGRGRRCIAARMTRASLRCSCSSSRTRRTMRSLYRPCRIPMGHSRFRADRRRRRARVPLRPRMRHPENRAGTVRSLHCPDCRQGRCHQCRRRRRPCRPWHRCRRPKAILQSRRHHSTRRQQRRRPRLRSANGPHRQQADRRPVRHTPNR